MAQLLILGLILADAYVIATMADQKGQTTVQSSSAPISNTTPAPNPCPPNEKNLYKAQAPMNRKMGKHHPSMSKSFNAPALSPSSAPASAKQAAETEENVSILEQEIHLKKHHHRLDRSVAGGGVILGGLATTFLVAVFCYIRATTRHKAETSAQIAS